MNPSIPGMTSESNQQFPTSVFSFDPYPPPFGVNWNQPNPFANRAPQFNPNNAVSGQPQTYSGGPFSPGPPAVSQMSSPMATTSVRTAMNPVLDQRPNSGMVPFTQPQSTFSFGSPRPLQELVQFPFQITNNESKQREFRFKRKTDSPPLQPSKQHITEEKMAEHMSRLHINSETAASTETGSDQVQRLYMCEEMRKFQCESILPQRIVSLIQSPCTALVLWKPPAKLVADSDDDGGERNENNNAESVPDGHDMDDEDAVCINNMDMDNC
ncbi:unnamed protein product [Phaedon cochleariae]|uniref:Uncharacterized protein n=1 Tax=Phaedon cochleariae TaxID=80249 RepID=A0A9P0GSH9_PHACE|nr:unnamed protein product [Phaedon cochleariae]